MSKFNYWQKFEDNVCYHIYNRGINSTTIFKKQENYYFFLRKWHQLIHPFFDTLGYCLMPNHFHFLVKVKSFSSDIDTCIKEIKTMKSENLMIGKVTYNEFLEDQFKRLFSSYALAFNKQETRTGSLFQKRFKRVGIYGDQKLLKVLSYIHHNPIHHKITSRFDRWKFSSYSTLLDNRPALTNKEMVLKLFDNDFDNAKILFKEHHLKFKLDKEIELETKFAKP